MKVEGHSQRKSKNLKPISTMKSGAQKVVKTVAAMAVEVGMVVTGKKVVSKDKLKISGLGKHIVAFQYKQLNFRASFWLKVPLP